MPISRVDPFREFAALQDRMNRLFGVTMAERGVSQLVSVDLEAAERIREAS